ARNDPERYKKLGEKLGDLKGQLPAAPKADTKAKPAEDKAPSAEDAARDAALAKALDGSKKEDADTIERHARRSLTEDTRELAKKVDALASGDDEVPADKLIALSKDPAVAKLLVQSPKAYEMLKEELEGASATRADAKALEGQFREIERQFAAQQIRDGLGQGPAREAALERLRIQGGLARTAPEAGNGAAAAAVSSDPRVA